jgi:hypothetical protein
MGGGYVSNPVARSGQKNFLAPSASGRPSGLRSSPNDVPNFSRVTFRVTEHRLEAYATLTPSRGRDGYVAHPAQGL